MTNIAFTRIVSINKNSLEFNFRKLPGDNMNFHADVTDAKGNRIQFSMYRDAHTKWHATGNHLPLWIANSEGTIGNNIEMELEALSTAR
jgi:hypothetical protein